MKRFPLGLTLAAGFLFVALVGLGAWQVRRLEWKEALLAHIAALRGAPPRPIEVVLAHLARGGSVDFVRVSAVCGPSPAQRSNPPIFRYALEGEQVAWRVISPCSLAAPPYDGMLVDRGLAESLTGAMEPRSVAVRPPASLIGILRAPPSWSFGDAAKPETSGGIVTLRVLDAAALRAAGRLAGLARPAPVLLQTERETPPPPGITAKALPSEISNNHLVYAITWFALAAILAWFYAALLVRRARGQ